MCRMRTCLALAALIALASPAYPSICDVDERPAATLLVPYFEVSPGLPASVNTLLSIQNAEATPVLANLTVWTDVGIPVLGFPFALNGYDVYTLDLASILATGAIPPSVGSNHPSCNGFFPLGNIPAQALQKVRDSLTGKPLPPALGNNLCEGLAIPARPNNPHGFVTIDVVGECTLLFPTDVQYFIGGGKGVALNRNALWGTTFFVDNTASLAHALPMVHIEADAKVPETETRSNPTPQKPPNYTFYSRLVEWTARDNREPLATDFGIRFYIAPPFGATELFVWRDSKTRPRAFPCPPQPRPSAARLGQGRITAFNEEGGSHVYPPRRTLPFQVMAQRVKVNGSSLVIPPAIGSFGWLFLNLNHSQGGPEVPLQYTGIAQAWVFGITNVVGPPPYTGAWNAVRYDSACRGRAKPALKLP